MLEVMLLFALNGALLEADEAETEVQVSISSLFRLLSLKGQLEFTLDVYFLFDLPSVLYPS